MSFVTLNFSNVLKRVRRQEFVYMLLMSAATFLTFIRSICYGAFLSPREMGYYAIAVTIASYGAFLQLGLMSGLNRELPFRMGQKGPTGSDDLVGETTSAITMLQMAGFFLFFAVLWSIKFENSFKKEAMVLGGLLAFSNTFAQMVLLRLRAEQKILGFSWLQTIQASGFLLIGVLLIPWMRYRGAVIAAILVNIISFAVVSRYLLEPVNYRFFKKADLVYLIRIGMPMMLAGVLVNLQLGMDRLFLIKRATPSELGIYQIGMLPLALGIAGSGIVSQYLSPKLLYRYGQGLSLGSIFEKSLRVSLLVILAMLVLFPLVNPAASYIIGRWLPRYTPSLPFIDIFYFGAIFTAANITGVVINAANRQHYSLFLAIFMVLICFVSYIAVCRYRLPLVWFAYVNVCVQILNYLLETSVSFIVVCRNKAKNK